MRTIKGFSDMLKSNRIKPWLMAGAVLYPIFLVCMVEIIHFNSLGKFFGFLIHSPQVFAFDIVLITVFYAVTLLFLRYVWVTALITGGLLFSMAMVDYNKFATLRQYLFPWDLLLAKNVESFTTISAIYFSFYIVIFFILLILLVVIFFMSKLKLKLKLIKSLPIAVLSAIIITFLFNTNLMKNNVLAYIGVNEEGLNPVDIYEKNGLIASFYKNVGVLKINRPKDYSKEVFNELGGASSVDEKFVKPDIVVILSEAFWDVTKLPNTEFSVDPLSNLHELQKTTISGEMVSPTCGGGTVRPEFEMLTGLTVKYLPPGSIPYQQYLKKPIWSYAWHYKSLGYKTKAIHPYTKTFYDRDRCMPLLGFDEYIGLEDIEKPGLSSLLASELVDDKTFTDLIIESLEEEADPQFLFGITIQNHTPFKDKFEEHAISVKNDKLSEEDQNILLNYAEGVRRTDEQLKRLVEYIDSRERPTVLVYFGDHLPALGVNYAAYVDSGYINGNNPYKWTTEEEKKMLSTPLIIHSNYDTGREIKIPERGISPFYVLELMSEYIGAPQTSFMKFLSELRELAPVDNSSCREKEMEASDDLINSKSKFHWLITYDRLIGDGYTNENIYLNVGN